MFVVNVVVVAVFVLCVVFSLNVVSVAWLNVVVVVKVVVVPVFVLFVNAVV